MPTRGCSIPRRPASLGRVLALALGLVLAVGALVLPGAPLRPVPAVAGEGWHWPVDPPRAVVRRFEPGATRYSAGHYGVDLRAAVGRPVRAVGAGRVSYSGLLAGRGVVVVDHGGIRTTYEPLDRAVRLGQGVAAGTVLGTLTAGHACSPSCLHLGLRRGDEYLDPMTLFGGPPRLLPRNGRAEAGARSRAAGGAVAGTPPARGDGSAPGETVTSRVSGSTAAAASGRTTAAASEPTTGRAQTSPSASSSGAGTRPTTASRRPGPVPLGRTPAGLPSPAPWWRRVGADGPEAAVAVLALVAGLVLVHRPSSPSPEGGSAGGVVRPVVVAPDELPRRGVALSAVYPQDGQPPVDDDACSEVPPDGAAAEHQDAEVVELEDWRARRSS